MKEIFLTQGKVALVDDEDYERLNQFKWCAHRDGYNWYPERSNHYIDDKQKTILMHREIMNAPKGIEVDHRDWDGLNNQKENLRLCTHQQNARNRHAQKNNKLGVKGVRWHKNTKKFQARIQVDYKSIHLGLFTIIADADQAYRIAEDKYFGEFSRKQTF